jgi:hypothetical protein
MTATGAHKYTLISVDTERIDTDDELLRLGSSRRAHQLGLKGSSAHVVQAQITCCRLCWPRRGSLGDGGTVASRRSAERSFQGER